MAAGKNRTVKKGRNHPPSTTQRPTAESFRRCRVSTGLCVAAAAQALCVTTRTVRNWEAGHNRPPAMALTALRTRQNEHMLNGHWADWKIHANRLWAPNGRSYAPWELEQLDAVFRQAVLFRTLYDQLHPKRPPWSPPIAVRGLDIEPDAVP